MTLSIPRSALNAHWPHAAHSLCDGIVATSESVFAKRGLTTKMEVVDFLAQISEETGGGVAIEENLNYTPQRLCQVWPSRFPTVVSAAPFAHNPRGLADYVYGGRYGNVPGTDDGYVYRGRGAIQVTFHDWYQKLSSASGLDLITDPDLVNDPEHFLDVAAAFWKLDGVNSFADRGDFRGETIRVNGGLTNYAARLQWRAVWAAAIP